MEGMPKCICDYFYLLSTHLFTSIISEISGIQGLHYDEYLHGAGIHAHPRHGRLFMHLDYEKHPFTNKQRRLNVILYLNKEWNEAWNGHTELWDANMLQCIVKSPVVYNTAIIFKTTEESWHGLPEPIQCPQETYRQSLAYYYVSDLINRPDEHKIGNDGTGFRRKATFVQRPTDPSNEYMDELLALRSHRRLETDDLHSFQYDDETGIWNIHPNQSVNK
jgi:hypothetical protein